jgi:hypothetical protein
LEGVPRQGQFEAQPTGFLFEGRNRSIRSKPLRILLKPLLLHGCVLPGRFQAFLARSIPVRTGLIVGHTQVVRILA